MREQRLTGKVAVVTGASQGLGEHLAAELAWDGAAVTLAGRSVSRLEALQARIEEHGGTAVAVPTDLCQEDDCRELIRRTREKLGGIDILVLNAGAASFGKLEELESFTPIREAMAVNFFGAAYPTYVALPDLVARKGVIAYVTSGSGHLPMAGYLGYSTSKHAMNGFFECLRLEMFSRGVDVLAINPGDMYSDDGAGRTVLAPDGDELKVDLSVRREGDTERTPASEVAQRSCEAIVRRAREVDLSPRMQKVATRVRPFAPKLVDRRIYRKVTEMRGAFADLLADRNPG